MKRIVYLQQLLKKYYPKNPNKPITIFLPIDKGVRLPSIAA